MDNIIHNIHTPCKQCVFAQYNGNTQKDCHLGYIEKYKTANISIIEAYDNEKEFYIINDKKCIGYRENKWFDGLDLEDDSIQTKIDFYNQQNKLHYLVVVNLQFFNTESLDKLFKELSRCSVQPQKIILVRYRNTKFPFEYAQIENIIKDNNINYQWRIQTMLDSSVPYEGVLHNTTNINQKYRFILSVSEPTESFAYLVDRANSIVHEQLDQFIILSNPNKTSILYSGAVYRFGIVHNENILQNFDKYTIL